MHGPHGNNFLIYLLFSYFLKMTKTKDKDISWQFALFPKIKYQIIFLSHVYSYILGTINHEYLTFTVSS